MKHVSVVLVVEDDPAARELYRATLRHAGYAVVAVEDGLDALQFLETTVPAAVVLDLGLPRVSGYDVYREMAARDVSVRVPIIVVTGTGTAPPEFDHDGFACVLQTHRPGRFVSDHRTLHPGQRAITTSDVKWARSRTSVPPG